MVSSVDFVYRLKKKKKKKKRKKKKWWWWWGGGWLVWSIRMHVVIAVVCSWSSSVVDRHQVQPSPVNQVASEPDERWCECMSELLWTCPQQAFQNIAFNFGVDYSEKNLFCDFLIPWVHVLHQLQPKRFHLFPCTNYQPPCSPFILSMSFLQFECLG